MLSLIIYAALIYAAIKMIAWAVKAAWEIFKVVAFIILLPAIILGLAFSGMFLLALGIVSVMAVISTIGSLILL